MFAVLLVRAEHSPIVRVFTDYKSAEIYFSTVRWTVAEELPVILNGTKGVIGFARFVELGDMELKRAAPAALAGLGRVIATAAPAKWGLPETKARTELPD